MNIFFWRKKKFNILETVYELIKRRTFKRHRMKYGSIESYLEWSARRNLREHTINNIFEIKHPIGEITFLTVARKSYSLEQTESAWNNL